MPGSLGNAEELAILDTLLGAVAYTPRVTLYAALFTTAPTYAGGGVEASGTNYARVAITNNLTNFPAATSGGPALKANGTAVTFPTAGASWGTAAAVALMSASSGGALVAWAPLTTPRAIANTDTPSFAIGSLSFSLT